MRPVIQEDLSGCAIASVAVLSGNRYDFVKRKAAGLGITVTDPALWSTVGPMRHLLAHLGIESTGTRDFISWDALPDRALLAIKWHTEKNGSAWHWVVFVRKEGTSYVLDSKKTLRSNRRTDFGRIKPKWFMEVTV